MTEQAKSRHANSDAHSVNESTFRALSSCQIGAMRWREKLGATAVNSVAQSLLALPAAATCISEEVFFERIYDEDRDRVRRSFDHYLQSRSLQSKEIHMRVVAAETGAVKKLN